ncbi:MAG: hypothetical protein ACRC68_10760, partial [Clostridium sp.]
MIVRDFKNKPYIEKTENELILYRRTGKKVFRLDNVKYICLTDGLRLKIFYENKYVDFNVDKRNDEDHELLIELVESTTNSQKIYYYTGQSRAYNIGNAIYWIALATVNVFIVNYNDMKYFWIILATFWLLSIILNIRKLNYFEYDLKDGIINLKGGIKSKDNIINVNNKFKVESKVIMGNGSYRIKVNKNKIAVNNDILVPRNYKEEMKKLYDMK